jgi:HEAT repeat protein
MSMRAGKPVMILICLACCSGVAGAMSTMPNGEGDPYPIVIALLALLALLACAYIAVDRLESFIVDRMKRDGDTEGLIGALKSDWFAPKAACALGDMKSEQAVGALIEALNDKNSDVRQAAAKALGDIGDERAAGPLRLTLADRYRGVRDCASYALKKLQKPDNAL